ncbi:hypothetical protein GCM10009541_59510 [Micromonospora gifhornensis]|uniref:Uncharacterized protein n=1 Tax=Micromonospora gifhornensis TaxID=84594 RepID=A0ABQ4IME1_9ACTN|nr:hypothetical protein Vgi01_57410 [Micromonospora gifhornensis]
MVEKVASATALSKHDPTRPIDWRTFQRAHARAKSAEQYSAAPVAVKDHPCDVTAAGDRGHFQRGDDQAGVVAFAHGVAEDPSGVQVDDGGEVELALLRGDLRHVAAPGHVRRGRGELTLDQVRGGRPFALLGARSGSAAELLVGHCGVGWSCRSRTA